MSCACTMLMRSLASPPPSRRRFMQMGGALALGSLGAIGLSRAGIAAAEGSRLSPDRPAGYLAAASVERPALPAQPPASGVLIRDVRIFDGRGDRLAEGLSVLVQGNRIERIAPNLPAPAGAQVVDGGRRVLMPGLIDAHWHAFMGPNTVLDMTVADESYLHAVAAAEAIATLMRGFTTIRDAAGPVFGLKRAIDEGILPGPRIYPSGAMISQTSGHGDFRTRAERPRRFGGHVSRGEELGIGLLADGEAEVLTAVREQLRLGASQIKLAAGGGVASDFDPIDVNQYTFEELRAAVRAAADWNTYVMVHIYTPEGVRRAIEAGVRSIEHGHLLDEPTMKLIADTDTWLCLQPFLAPQSANIEKSMQVIEGTNRAYPLAKQYGVKLAFGTDRLFSRTAIANQSQDLVELTRWFTPAETLRMATGTNGELMALSGLRNPYPDGKLGVIEERAYADLLLVNGNPLEDLSLLGQPAQNLALIMKNGQIYKNTLA